MHVILGEYLANRKMVSFLWKGTILEFAFTYPSIFCGVHGKQENGFYQQRKGSILKFAFKYARNFGGIHGKQENDFFLVERNHFGICVYLSFILISIVTLWKESVSHIHKDRANIKCFFSWKSFVIEFVLRFVHQWPRRTCFPWFHVRNHIFFTSRSLEGLHFSSCEREHARRGPAKGSTVVCVLT